MPEEATMFDETPKPTGRPPGSPNKEYPEVKADAPRCRVASCQSTELEVLKRLPDQWYAGLRPDGKPFTLIVRRRVRCKVCGSVMILTTYENRKQPKPRKERSKK